MDQVANQALLNEYETYHVKAMDMQEILLKAGYPKSMKPCKKDYKFLCYYFHGLQTEKVKKTFEVTAQDLQRPCPTRMEKIFKTPYPFANCFSRKEKGMMDMTVFKTPDVFGGKTQAMFFTGTKSYH